MKLVALKPGSIAIPLFGSVLAVVIIVSCLSAQMFIVGTQAANAAELDLRRAEVIRRQDAIRAELYWLDDHPWAGSYRTPWGDVALVLAPESGFVITSHGCSMICGANWGTVTEHEGKIHLDFARTNTPGEFANFESDYTIEREGDDCYLRRGVHDDYYASRRLKRQ